MVARNPPAMVPSDLWAFRPQHESTRPHTMNSTTILPYELHTNGSGAFVIFNVTDEIALPLIALARATRRTRSDLDEIVLEFQTAEVVIEGRGLALMLDHLLLGKVKRISCACDAASEVARIQIRETHTH